MEIDHHKIKQSIIQSYATPAGQGSAAGWRQHPSGPRPMATTHHDSLFCTYPPLPPTLRPSSTRPSVHPSLPPDEAVFSASLLSRNPGNKVYTPTRDTPQDLACFTAPNTTCQSTSPPSLSKPPPPHSRRQLLSLSPPDAFAISEKSSRSRLALAHPHLSHHHQHELPSTGQLCN